MNVWKFLELWLQTTPMEVARMSEMWRQVQSCLVFLLLDKSVVRRLLNSCVFCGVVPGPGAEGTFVDYMPKKLRIGKKHPGAVVETSVLARAVPPDIR